ncbi:MAG: hypothetical protein ACHQRJ_21775 [Alphaproteobacteria bacterium]
MTRISNSLFLRDAIGVLVQHFGLERVQAALAKVSIGRAEAPQERRRKIVSGDRKPARPTAVDALELVREGDPEKHRMLSEFLDQFRDRRILPESQDIRHFSQLIGLKDIKGKSRRDMLPTLLRFLAGLPTERLRIYIQRADNISEQQRQRGFSVLTDKLLGEK